MQDQPVKTFQPAKHMALQHKMHHDQRFKRVRIKAHPPHTVPAGEVLEVWKYGKHITDKLPENEPSLQQLMDMVKEVKMELERLKKGSG